VSTRQTHTYAVLKVSQSAYDEIREKLQTAAYDHAFHENGIIDMHGIALQTNNPVIGKASSNLGQEFAPKKRSTKLGNMQT
jgi:hypothetical protein